MKISTKDGMHDADHLKPVGAKLLVVLLLFFKAAYAQPADGLVAGFLFNDGTTRSTTNLPSAIAHGASPAEDRFGNPDAAYYLHGNRSSYLNLGTSKKLKPTTGSVSLWFKRDMLVYSGAGFECTPLIITKSHAGNDFFEGYAASIAWTTGNIYTSQGFSEKYFTSAHSRTPVYLGRWHHVVFCYNDQVIWLYLDGALQAAIRKDFRTRFLESDSVMAGNSANVKNDRFLNGSIDDILFYDRVLSAKEVGELYRAPNPRPYSLVVKWGLFALGILVVVIVVVWILIRRYKKELERERQKSLLQSQMYEMETRIRQAQMNPHFIFNAMNSVQHFILANDNENAYKYLVKFSRLLRETIENTNDELVALNTEIESLNSYLELESLRFEHSFQYTIVTDARLNPLKMGIPQMLVQPFVENAIWHGLLPKKGKGKISVRFEYAGDNIVCCVVEDDGIGRRRRSEEPITGRRSRATDFVEERLRLMRRRWGGPYRLTITDKKDAEGNNMGTWVELYLPLHSLENI